MKKNSIVLIAGTILFAACNQQEKNQTINKQAPMEHQHEATKNLMMKAMDESMVAMHKAKQTGNADYDFASMMIPHHEGAVAMAGDLIRHNKSPQLIDFAKQVIIAQKKEIERLRLFIKTADQTPLSNAQAFKEALSNSMLPMMEGMNTVALSNNIDKDFVTLMIPHHQSAIAMARAYLPYGRNTEVKKIATAIIKAQVSEIDWLKEQ